MHEHISLIKKIINSVSEVKMIEDSYNNITGIHFYVCPLCGRDSGYTEDEIRNNKVNINSANHKDECLYNLIKGLKD